jgi:hypothetical protein
MVQNLSVILSSDSDILLFCGMVFGNVEAQSSVYMLRSKLHDIIGNKWECVEITQQQLRSLFLDQDSQYFPHVASIVGCDYSTLKNKSWITLRKDLAGKGNKAAFTYFNDLVGVDKSLCLVGIYGFLHQKVTLADGSNCTFGYYLKENCQQTLDYYLTPKQLGQDLFPLVPFAEEIELTKEYCRSIISEDFTFDVNYFNLLNVPEELFPNHRDITVSDQRCFQQTFEENNSTYGPIGQNRMYTSPFISTELLNTKREYFEYVGGHSVGDLLDS